MYDIELKMSEWMNEYTVQNVCVSDVIITHVILYRIVGKGVFLFLL